MSWGSSLAREQRTIRTHAESAAEARRCRRALRRPPLKRWARDSADGSPTAQPCNCRFNRCEARYGRGPLEIATGRFREAGDELLKLSSAVDAPRRRPRRSEPTPQIVLCQYNSKRGLPPGALVTVRPVDRDVRPGGGIVFVQPHHACRAGLIEVDEVAAGPQKVAERFEAQRLMDHSVGLVARCQMSRATSSRSDSGGVGRPGSIPGVGNVTRRCASVTDLAGRQRLLTLHRWLANPDRSCRRARILCSPRRGR